MMATKSQIIRTAKAMGVKMDASALGRRDWNTTMTAVQQMSRELASKQEFTWNNFLTIYRYSKLSSTPKVVVKAIYNLYDVAANIMGTGASRNDIKPAKKVTLNRLQNLLQKVVQAMQANQPQ